MDRVNGGLRGAPKFPNPPMLEFLWRHAARTRDAASRGAFLLTLRRMCEGGIYDQLGGGFARYSVDERWLVPHFEKMLYDNAQLLELLSLAWLETGEAIFEEAVRETVEWLRREMRAPGGGFCASLDADSEGVEGKFYVWTRDEIEDVLGQEDAAFFARHYDAGAEGNWSDEQHDGGAVVILNRLQAPSATVEERHRLAVLRGKLLARRTGRTRPGLDDKVLADWNGLTVAALVHASVVFGEASWMKMAREAFDFIAKSMVRTVDGQPRLGHAWRGGALVWPGMASDYAAMMRAALALAEAEHRRGCPEPVRPGSPLLAGARGPSPRPGDGFSLHVRRRCTRCRVSRAADIRRCDAECPRRLCASSPEAVVADGPGFVAHAGRPAPRSPHSDGARQPVWSHCVVERSRSAPAQYRHRHRGSGQRPPSDGRARRQLSKPDGATSHEIQCRRRLCRNRRLSAG